jgi:hemerythrin-like domain-containing protein
MTTERLAAWSEEMREVHRRLREALELARGSVTDGSTADPLAHPLLYCWGFCSALSGHHRSEDGALFPLVVEAHPDLAPVVAQLTQDHHLIEHLIGALQQAIEQGAPTTEKLRHLDGIEAVMESHFRYEERRLLSVLDGLESLNRTGEGQISTTDVFGPLA